MQDNAFDSFVEMSVVAEAWDSFDIDGLWDAALQLKLGEQVLRRVHRSGLESQALMKLVVQSAALTGQRAVMARVRASIDQQGDPEVEGAIKAAELALAKGVVVASAAELPPRNFVPYKQALRDLAIAKLSGDKELGREGQDRWWEFTGDLASRDLVALSRQDPAPPDPAVTRCIRVLDGITNEPRDLQGTRRKSGEFQVRANQRDGYLWRNLSNWTYFVFEAEGTWTYYPHNGWFGPEGNPNHIADSPDFLLPGRPVGGLILTRPGISGFEWCGEYRQIPVPQTGAVKFYCNDTRDGFGDNQGWLLVHVHEAVGPIH